MEDDTIGSEFGDLNLLGDPQDAYFFKRRDMAELQKIFVDEIMIKTRKSVRYGKHKYDKYYFFLVKKYIKYLLENIDLWLYLDWVQPHHIDKEDKKKRRI